MGGGGGFLWDKKPGDQAKKQATPKIRGWVEEMLPEEDRSDQLPGGKAPKGSETNVMVAQLACKEDDCPDVETAITLMRPKSSGKDKLLFKIYKPAAEITREEVEAALLKAKAAEEFAQGHGHGVPPREAEASATGAAS